MAVMTTQHSEGVAFEQKAMPVPSSDKMALDIDINGNSNHDEPTLDVASPDFALNKTDEISPSNALTSSLLDFNSDANLRAVSSSAAISAPPTDTPPESQPTKDSPMSAKNINPSQLPDTNTTTSDDLQTFPLPDVEPTPALLPYATQESAHDTAINSALQDTTATSTVLPVVEALESDLRDTTSPLVLAPEVPAEKQPEQLSPSLDLNPETEVLPSMDGVIDSGAGLQVADVTFDSSIIDPPQPSADAQMMQTPPSDADRTTEPGTSNMGFNDTEMTDAPQPAPSTKVSRDREDDNESEPSAKRTKTEDDTMMTGYSSSDIPTAGRNGESGPVKSESSPISPYESKEIIKILKNVLRSQGGKNFRAPVGELWPGFAEKYAAKVPNPIDLATIEKKLRDNAYPCMDAFKADVQLLYDNALLFNGLDHLITKAGQGVRDTILSKVSAIPPEPVAAPKVPKKPAKRATPVAEPAPRATPARRPSRSGGAGATPSTAPPAPTFALDPSTNTPLIRRDSTKGDGGRPKREIHPPKNKDPIYASRPKNKKFATELKFCEEVLAELKKPKHAAFSAAFMIPVDPVALNIPNYFTVIKNPMDVSTVAKRLHSGSYQKAKDFELDVKLIFANCFKFNPPGNPVNLMGKQLEEVFNAAWARKDQWISDHSPAAATPSSNDGSDEEESEEEEEVEQHAQGHDTAALRERLTEEQDKLIQMMTSKKPDQAMIQMQQELVSIIKKRVEDATAPPKKPVKKPKAPKAAKKTAPAKKAGAAATKKSAPARQKYLGTLEKEVISAGLTSLPDDVSGVVLEMIKGDQPGVDVGDDGTLELDIDTITTPTLWKIHALIMKHAPEVEASIKRQMEEKEPPRALAKPAQKKKNKPMSKNEQERKIEQLQNLSKEFERQGSGSQEPVMPTVEQQDESSGDEDSSDSEEE